MKRRDLLKGLATLPALSMFGNALVDDKNNYKDKDKKAGRRGPAAILRILISGPFALVIDQKQPDKITFFCPFDQDGYHRFYFEGQEAKDTKEAKGSKSSFHLELRRDGLDTYSRKRPYIDQCFRDITFHTDVWQRKDYFVTFELPVPDSIGFIPPEQPVTFQGDRPGLMPQNNLLEYRITDPDDVKIVSNIGTLKPLPVKALMDEYERYCGSHRENKSDSSACSEFDYEFKSWNEQDVRTFHLGVDIYDKLDEDQKIAHAIKFYNGLIAESFPRVKGKDLIAIGGIPNRTPTHGAMLMPAVFDQLRRPPVLRTVSAVMECKVIGPHALLP